MLQEIFTNTKTYMEKASKHLSVISSRFAAARSLSMC